VWGSFKEEIRGILPQTNSADQSVCQVKEYCAEW